MRAWRIFLRTYGLVHGLSRCIDTSLVRAICIACLRGTIEGIGGMLRIDVVLGRWSHRCRIVIAS